MLDEFHTYDGAQGTDVAMLLRRLGIALKSHWDDGDAVITTADRDRPLGRITPVATSATLGDRGDPTTMISFARTVFGDDFDEASVVTESRLTVGEWVDDSPARVTAQGLVPRRLRDLTTDEVHDLVRRSRTLRDDPEALAGLVVATLYDAADESTDADALRDRLDSVRRESGLLTLVKALPDVQDLARECAEARPREDLVELLFPGARADRLDDETLGAALDHLVAALSHVRAEAGRDALTVELNLWVRELTRIDRDASTITAYHWFDEGERIAEEGETVAPSFPAIYCRHCGRSGWGVELATVGQDLHADDRDIRRRHAMREGRFRALLSAPTEEELALSGTGEAEAPAGLVWFFPAERQLVAKAPSPDDEARRAGLVLPVLTHVGPDADDFSRGDTCPSCLQADGIRFLGSAIATMLSVTLSSIFGSPHLDAREKKSLVFTDSVQDAAHRAGFIEARSHTLTFRAMLRDALDDSPCTVDELVQRVIADAGSDPFRRYRMIPPGLVGRPEFDAWWRPARTGQAGKARSLVQRRLLFDTTLELGLQSTFGRTLERVGSAVVEVAAGSATALASLGRETFTADGVEQQLGDPLSVAGDGLVTAWVRGVLEHIRERGGITHLWLDRYLNRDGRRWDVWGGRPRTEGMPAFPPGRAAPAFPRVGGTPVRDSLLDPVTSSQSWYAVWTARMLGVSPGHGAVLARLLLARLARAGILSERATEAGATVYGIPPEMIRVAPVSDAPDAPPTLLVCDVCRTPRGGTLDVVRQLSGQRCHGLRCPGYLRPQDRTTNFYRELYASADMRRIVSREHSSLLEDEERLLFESQFRTGADDPAAPNVLVATPTLEMGIDIGDLSTVVLASLPRTVASYLQRVGRAGRLTGNALNLAFVTGRGEHLPRIGDPLSVINGEVRPPATYLDAEEILQRQYIASVVDRMARTADQQMPGNLSSPLASAEPGSFLGDLVELAEENADEIVDTFLDAFESLSEESRAVVRAWATPGTDASGTVDRGTSGLAALVYSASQRWKQLDSDLIYRRQEIIDSLADLRAAAEGPAATDDDRRDFRSAEAALRLVDKQLSNHRRPFWVAALEEYGLLPNYTLMDDDVQLDVAVTWRDPESNAWMSDPRTFNRASALALRDFAPGATFYARGLAMTIDGLDVGTKANLIERWAWCDTCGYAAPLAADTDPPTTCPRCQNAQIADAAQRIEVVPLTRVLSEVRRDEAQIDDRDDERQTTQFVIATAADLDPAEVTRQWSANGGTFGVAHYRAMTVRWLNAGRRGTSASTASVAGMPLPTQMFRVCAECGKADSHADRNHRDEHRPWCRYRAATTEDTRTVGLTRTLRTQAVVVSLPLQVTLGDSFAVPSLAAAVLLGLRERIGGQPDHLEVTTVPAPVVGGQPGEVREALLLHDVVPGGTGYLTDLSSPEEVWELLTTALHVVSECPCRDEGRLACHRCLLPFSRGLGVENLSRLAAERHLRTILGVTADAEVPDGAAMGWDVAAGPVVTQGAESHLELLFRTVLRERLSTLNATVREKPGPTGNILTVTLGRGRVWTLTPQQLVQGCKPDFVLRSNDPSVPPVAIFTDGWTFHASTQHNRVADDAIKRSTLRAHGYVVLGLTEADLTDKGAHVLAHDWLTPELVSALMRQPAGTLGSGVTIDAADTLRRGPMDWLLSWIDRPHDAGRQALSDGVWLPLTARAGSRLALGSEEVTSEVVADLLVADVDAEPVRDVGATATWWREDHVGVLVRLNGTTPAEVVVALDDRDASLVDQDHRRSWQRWLQLSNAFALTNVPTVITSLLALAATSTAQFPTVEVEPLAAVRGEVPQEWELLMAGLLGGAAEANLALALLGAGIPVPSYGVEVANGIPVDFAWPNAKVAVLLDPLESDTADLAAEGWLLVPPDPPAIATAVTERTPS